MHGPNHHHHHHHHHHGSGRTARGSFAGAAVDSSSYSVRIKALLKLDTTLLGHDISRLLADERDLSTPPIIVDQLLEQLEECKREILRAVEVSSTPSSSMKLACYVGGRGLNDHRSRALLSAGKNTAHVCGSSSSTIPRCNSGNMPIEVLRQVAQSDYLSLKELGRFLLLVSKSFMDELGRELVWKILCCKEWKNTSKIPRNLIEVRGYHWLFQQRVNDRGGLLLDGKRQVPRPFSSGLNHHGLLFAQNLSPDTLVLLTSIWRGSKEVASLAFTADPLSTLVATGELNVRLENPISLGEFPVSENGVIDMTGGFSTDEFDDWRATIHCVRLDEFKCCCIHETSSCAWGEYDYIVDPSSQSSIYNENGSRHNDPNKRQKLGTTGDDESNSNDNTDESDGVEVDMGYLDFSPNSDGMEFTGMGKALLSRIREYDTHSDRLLGIRLDATLLCFTQGFRQDAKSVQLSFSELRLEVWKSYMEGSAVLFNSTSEAQKHGVTLLHLFDHLNGFK